MIVVFTHSAPMITPVMPGKWRRRLSKDVTRQSAGHGTRRMVRAGTTSGSYRRNTDTIVQ